MTTKKIMFQNRKALIRDRGQFLKKAFDMVNGLVDSFKERHNKENGPEELLVDVEELVKTLRECRFFGFRSIGGDALNPPKSIQPKEFALIDHISVLYSSARTIAKLLNHECAVRKYERNHKNKDKRLQKYIKDVESDDKKLILQNLKNMKSRMDLFNNFYGNINS